MADSVYNRAMLKLSGRAIIGKSEYGIDPESANYVAQRIKVAHDMGVQMAVVIGGGNIWRGAEAAAHGMDRSTADYAGMLATVINSLALQDALERQGLETRHPGRHRNAVHRRALTSAAAPSATWRRAASSSSPPAPATPT